MSNYEFLGKCLLLKEGEERILVIGDLHLGYEEALQRAGVLVPRKLFGEIIEELKKVLGETEKVHQVVLLGDVKHTFGSILWQEQGDVLELIDFLREYAEEVVLIKGNHDAILEPLAEKKDLTIRESYSVGSVAFVHGDKDQEELWRKDIKTWIVGHGHPAITLSDGVKSEKYKCFLEGEYKGRKVIVVPSFTMHNEGTDPRDYDLGFAWPLKLNRFRVKAVGEGLEVLDFGEVGKLRR